jgi:hypothetical protein
LLNPIREYGIREALVIVEPIVKFLFEKWSLNGK